mmetsp:Transcript_54425/g.176026  ORF Transcript_54425/g.176026 Transcript_54425/m.176026 type:complete len:1181 (-) Transcript_54425:1721-5263(-)
MLATGGGSMSDTLKAHDEALLEIATFSPRRSDYHGMEQNNFSEFPLPSLCAHDGFAFLAQSLLRETREACRLAGEHRPPELEKRIYAVLEHRTGRLAKRAYLRGRDLYSWDGRLSQAEEDCILGRGFLAQRPTCFKQHLDWDAQARIRSVAVPLLTMQSGAAAFDLTSFILAKDPLIGWTKQRWQHTSISLWANVRVRELWLDIYDAARTESVSLALCFLLSYIAYHDRSAVPLLQQLALIAAHSSRFSAIVPPDHAHYNSPSEAEFDEDSVKQWVDRQLKKFDEIEEHPPRGNSVRHENERAVMLYEQRKTLHEQKRSEVFHVLMGVMRSAWKRNTCVSESEIHFGEMVKSALELVSRVNAAFADWRAARDLHKFLARVNGTLGELQKDLPLSSSQAQVPLDCRLPSLEGSQPAPFWLEPPVAKTVPLTKSQTDMAKSGGFLGAISYQFQRGNGSAHAIPRLPILPDVTHPEIAQQLLEPLQESWELAHKEDEEEQQQPSLSESEGICGRLEGYLKTARERATDLWSKVERAVAPMDEVGQSLQRVGLWNDVVPGGLLTVVAPSPGQASCAWQSPDKVRDALIAYAVCLRHAQRAQRCLRFISGPDSSAALRKELAGIGCEGWSPQEFPAWLMLEIDNNFCIRKVQADVARMLLSSMEHKENVRQNMVSQLNMGEGKTAVIIPMVASALADGTACVRVTVLTSLCVTSAADWQWKIGGLLGRRVFPLACRRDLPLGLDEARLMLHTCTRVRQEGHMIVTVPEHRLSIENKALELAWNGDQETSQAFHMVLDFCEEHCRDVLDESDEILRPKYQQIYTLGGPVVLDGERLRWATAAAVLRSVDTHALALQKRFGKETIEILSEQADGGQFSVVRLLQQSEFCSDVYEELCKHIADDVLRGTHPEIRPWLLPHEQEAWRRTVLSADVRDEAGSERWSGFPENVQTSALILRGLLSHQVLFVALTKRWRVEFGAHPTDHRRKSAVPFRGKDAAADRTEFGHPDVALLLTTVHYYRGGLSIDQLDEVFARLVKMNEAIRRALYSKWTSLLPEGALSDRSLDELRWGQFRAPRAAYGGPVPGAEVADACRRLLAGPGRFPCRGEAVRSQVGVHGLGLMSQLQAGRGPRPRPTHGLRHGLRWHGRRAAAAAALRATEGVGGAQEDQRGGLAQLIAGGERRIRPAR